MTYISVGESEAERVKIKVAFDVAVAPSARVIEGEPGGVASLMILIGSDEVVVP